MSVDGHRSRRIAETASALTAVLIVLVVVGYMFCIWLFFAAPRFIEEPMTGMSLLGSDHMYQAAVGMLIYWVVAFSVALGCAVVITVLGVRALQRLWECSPESLIVERVDEADPAATIRRLDRQAPAAGSAGSASGEKR